MSPIEIETMLYVYYDASGQYAGYNQSDAGRKAFVYLAKQGLILWNYDFWLCTEKGHAFVDLLLSTPIPIRKEVWIDPRTNRAIKTEVNQ